MTFPFFLKKQKQNTGNNSNMSSGSKLRDLTMCTPCDISADTKPSPAASWHFNLKPIESPTVSHRHPAWVVWRLRMRDLRCSNTMCVCVVCEWMSDCWMAGSIVYLHQLLEVAEHCSQIDLIDLIDRLTDRLIDCKAFHLKGWKYIHFYIGFRNPSINKTLHPWNTTLITNSTKQKQKQN